MMLFMSERGSLFDMNINNPSNEILFVYNICLSLNNNKKSQHTQNEIRKRKEIRSFWIVVLNDLIFLKYAKKLNFSIICISFVFAVIVCVCAHKPFVKK